MLNSNSILLQFKLKSTLNRKMMKITFLMMIFIIGNCHLGKNTDHFHKEEADKYFCKEVEHKISIVELSDQQHRLLQSSSSHSFKITPYFTSSTQSKLQVINRLFVIAAKYFEEVITVTTLSQSLSIFNGSPNSCSIKGDGVVPSSYTSSGFNVSVTDQVIFVEAVSSSGSFLASAAACIIRKWPTYGVIAFNLNRIDIDVVKRGQFHNNIYVTMHQMTHIMGFSSDMYSKYYTAYESNTRIPHANVVGTMNGESMIITPTVKAYVQSYFACSNPSIGALLENSGGQGSAGSHWERTIYLDQMMTASSFTTGLKVSQLTLSLLKDTGFYQNVDLSRGQRFEFGKGKGCNFASGTSSESPPQFCTSTSSSSVCDFYNTAIGFCTSDTFSAKKYITSFSNTVCNFPAASSSTNTFDVNSKCVVSNFGSGLTPHCMIAQCITPTVVRYTVNGNQGDCTQSVTTSISVGGVGISCPLDYTRFCARKTCVNFCGSAGLCLNGNCIMANITEVVLPPPEEQSSGLTLNIASLIGIIVPVVVGIVLVGLLILCCSKCFKESKPINVKDNPQSSSHQMHPVYNNPPHNVSQIPSNNIYHQTKLNYPYPQSNRVIDI